MVSLSAGETGVGKTVLVKRILQQLERDGGGRDGSAAKRTSILGSVLNYSEKSQNLLDHVGLVGGGQDEEEEDEGLNFEFFSGRAGCKLGIRIYT